MHVASCLVVGVVVTVAVNIHLAWVQFPHVNIVFIKGNESCLSPSLLDYISVLESFFKCLIGTI